MYKSDFYKEQRDRQRANGEVDEIKTDLHRTKKKMEKQRQEVSITLWLLSSPLTTVKIDYLRSQ